MAAAHAPQRPHPVHPRFLVGSKWSSAPGQDTIEYRHWEVIRHDKKRGEVVLRATLDREAELVLPWRALRDRAKWLPGWC